MKIDSISTINELDLIFCSDLDLTHHYRDTGTTTYFCPHSFEPDTLLFNNQERKYPVSFIGEMNNISDKYMPFFEFISKHNIIQWWGNGIQTLPDISAIRNQYHGSVSEKERFSILNQSKIYINPYIDHNFNRRLFEATGCGTLLITEHKDYLDQLFEIGTEIIVYRTSEECLNLIRYYLNNPDEAQTIAKAGQKKTLQHHTFDIRIKKTTEILERHLRYGEDKIPLPQTISQSLKSIHKSQIEKSLTKSWQNESIPFKQRGLTQQELNQMFMGKPPIVFQAMTAAISSIIKKDSPILEIGCSTGYYYEILEYLLNMELNYIGGDYSLPMIQMAKDYYPHVPFHVFDGAFLPYSNQSFSIVISSCILLHTPDYQEQIFETARIAKDYIIAHRTPICKKRPTSFFTKYAYDVKTVELIFNENEFISEFQKNGFKIINYVIVSENVIDDTYNITYVFKRMKDLNLNIKKEKIRTEKVTRSKEPLISVVRIRQDAINEMYKPVSSPKDTIFFQTIMKSQYQNIERINMSFLSYYDTKRFILSFAQTLERIKGDYVYFGTDFTSVDESFFSYSVDFLEEKTDYSGIVTRAMVSDRKGNISAEIFTKRDQTNEYSVMLNLLPQIRNNPSQLLAFVVWRKTSLNLLLSKLRQAQSLEKISSDMFQYIFSNDSPFKIHKSSVPNIIIYQQPSGNDYFFDAIEHYNKKEFQEALICCDKAKILNENIPDLNMYRAHIKLHNGDIWDAKIAAEAQLRKTPDNKQCTKFLIEINKILNKTELSYEVVEKNIKTVDGQLTIGQEQYLFEKVKSLPENATILEIGSRFGRSTVSLAYACVGTNKKIYSIDLFGGVSTDFQDIWKSTLLRLDLEDYVTPLPGASSEQLKKWGNKPQIDFVFIDASHYYTDTIEEFELVYPLVTDNGWIAFHDINWPGPLRTWYESATQILSSHEYCKNLGCGQKISGKKFIKPSLNKTYSYCEQWIESYKRKNENVLSEDLEKTITPHVKNDILEIAENNIASVQNKYKILFKDAISLINEELEACENSKLTHDPVLLYWNALILEKEGKTTEAIEALELASTIDHPKSPRDRIIYHLKRLKAIPDFGITYVFKRHQLIKNIEQNKLQKDIYKNLIEKPEQIMKIFNDGIKYYNETNVKL